MPGMRRRDVVALLGGVAAAWPVGTRAQQKPWVAAFEQRLRELGWANGHTIAVVYRWGEGQSERSDEVLAEFVRLNVDVIVVGRDRGSGGEAGNISHPDCVYVSG